MRWGITQLQCRVKRRWFERARRFREARNLFREPRRFVLMAKKETLKEQLQKAAKRRAARQAAAAQSPLPPSTAGWTAARIIDRILERILEIDKSQSSLTDRHLLAALRCLNRGYPSSDPVVTLLYNELQGVCHDTAVSARVLRDATEQLIETINGFEGRTQSSARSALTYFHSLAN